MTELQELRRYRRDLHRIPELDFDLPQTIAYIEGVLAPLACEVTHPLRLRFLRCRHGRRACHGDSRRYGRPAHCGGDGRGLCLDASRKDARLRTRWTHGHGACGGNLRRPYDP